MRAFEEQNPDIRVDIITIPFVEFWEKLPVMYSTGTLPDVLLTISSYYVQQWIREGAYLSLEPFIAREDPSFRADFVPGSLDAYSYRGEVYGLPYDVSVPTLYINLNAFDQAGLARPLTDEWTLEDMLEAAKRLTRRPGAGPAERVGLATNRFYWIDNYWSFWGARAFDTDLTRSTLDDPRAAEALQWWADLSLVHQVTPLSGDPAIFANGNIGMYPADSTEISQLRSAASFDWDVTYMPKGPGGGRGIFLGGGFAIGSQTRHPEEAWQLLKHLVSTETLAAAVAYPGRSVPGRTSAARLLLEQPAPPANIRIIVEELERGLVEPAPSNPYYFDFQRIVQPHIDRVFSGQTDARTALQAAVVQLNAMLAEKAQ